MATTTPSGEERRNFRLGVWNGAIYQMGEGFIDPHHPTATHGLEGSPLPGGGVGR